MESLRVKDLREIAKSKGLKGWYKLRKSELISFIHEFDTNINQTTRAIGESHGGSERKSGKESKVQSATSTKTRGSKARSGTTS